MDRRKFLTFSAAGVGGLFAGCPGQSDTPTETTPGGVSPEVTITATPLETAGKVSIDIDTASEEGLVKVAILLDENQLYVSEPGGEKHHSAETVVTVDENKQGRINTYTVRAEDTSGNVSEEVTESYARQYDILKKQRANIGAYYVPFFWDRAGRNLWEECTDGYPWIGRYEIDSSPTLSQQVDLMQGFGISRMVMQADSIKSARAFLTHIDKSVPQSIPVEIKYHYPNVIDWRGDNTIREELDDNTEFFKTNFLQLDNYSTRDGQPVVEVWDSTGPLSKRGQIYEFIKEEWGGYAGFPDYLREQFTVNGTEPYLIGMVQNIHALEYPEEEYIKGLQKFDAITHWFGGTAVSHFLGLDSGEPIPWEEIIKYYEKYYPSTQDFVKAHSLDCIPTTFYGFDNRVNTCWGDDKYIPRSPDHLKEMLNLANEYRTTDRINVATFNDWAEGHQIEPGKFRENEYNTTYVKQVREFQQGPVVRLRTAATETAGGLAVHAEYKGEYGLEAIEIALNGDQVFRNELDGEMEGAYQKTFSAAETEAVLPGEMNQIRSKIYNKNGNSTTDSTEEYVREFDSMGNHRLEIGTYYLPLYQRESRWEKCTDAEPEVGQYSMENSGAVARHIDLMQGFGITRLVLQVDDPRNSRAFIQRLEETLPSSMPIEIKYQFSNAVGEHGDRSIKEQFDRTIGFFRDNLLTCDNYATRGGSPVVTIGSIHGPIWNKGDIYEAMQHEWGGYAGWIDYLREQFTVAGKEPYLVGTVNNLEHVDNPKGEFRQGLQRFDGITNWFGIGGVTHREGIEDGEKTPWEAFIDYHKEYYPAAEDFVIENDMEFIPTVFYGMDARADDCRGKENYTSRSTRNLQEMLILAEKYRTGDRMNIATFNNWSKGNMLEPGTFRGEKQGTEYLEVVEDFQRRALS